jgi:hypothetical protein
MKMMKKNRSSERVAAGGMCRFTHEIVFTKTYEECEAVDFHHSGIIPPEYLDKVEANEIIFFYVYRRKEVHAWMFRWEDGLHTEERYSEVEKEIEEKLKGRM